MPITFIFILLVLLVIVARVLFTRILPRVKDTKKKVENLESKNPSMVIPGYYKYS
jgi:hypothetical protein